MKTTWFGYVRVSSRDQNEARQLKLMADLGIADRNIFVDKDSGVFLIELYKPK